MNAWESLLAVRAARLRLEAGLSLTEIAERLGVSRFKAGRLVQTARNSGWVTVRLAAPAGIEPELSERLAAHCARWGVRRALVTPMAGGRDALDRAAADAVEDSTVAGDVLGVACGRTINRVVAAVRRLPKCEVVQLTGLTQPGEVADSSVETMRRAARLTGIGVLPLYEPLVQPSAGTVAQRLGHPGLARALARWEQLTAALITIGAWGPGTSNVYDARALDDGGRHDATRAGAVAEFCGHLVDGEGRVVATEVTAQCLVVPWERLRSAREVTVVAADPARAAAVVAALRTGIVRTLVADEQTARRILHG